MKRKAAIAAKYAGLIALPVLAACGGGYGGSGKSELKVSLAVEPTTIALGQSATLTWSANQNAVCAASGGWDGAEPASGAAEVTPTAAGDITFTLTCSGGGYRGSKARSATLSVQPASKYTATSLVEDVAGGAAATADAHLVNPWGIAFGPITVVGVANNHSDTATLYDGNGGPSTLVAQFSAAAGAVPFEPTGVVWNGSPDFVLNGADFDGPAAFIFAGESGMIAGWSPAVDLANAFTMYADPDGAAYTGLAIANNGNGNFLYAADFANGKIDVFDGTFAKQAPTAESFAFDDPALPEGYAPFGIQAFDNGAGGTPRIYVSYAKHDEAEPDDEVAGPGLGIVNLFDANGFLLLHLLTEGGKLDAPWGLALAPADFGTLSDALLVGNFGDGTIHGYDPVSGRYLGTITDAGGAPFAVPGLWGIAFGNDSLNQPRETLFFAAGTNDEADGRYGRIDLGEGAPALGEPPFVTLIAPAGDLGGTVTLEADVQDAIAVADVRFYVNGDTLIGTATSAPFTVQWDTTAVNDGTASLRAVARDYNGNVGSSFFVTVPVTNAGAATLAQIQQAIFTPRCATCHDGSQPAGGPLPGSMDLRTGKSFASLVNVASQEQPNLLRVKPGEPDGSYLVHKLEGTPGISGERMPFGGPYLDQATTDQVRSWIASGAPDN